MEISRRALIAFPGAMMFSEIRVNSAQATKPDTGKDAAADIITAIQRPKIPAKTYFITDFGAKAGMPDALPAIRKAIDAASQAGGGRIIVPAGLWLLDGPIHLKSRIELHLDRDAELRFLPNPASYLPVVFTRWEGTECHNYSPFIYAIDQTDIAITGSGRINGQGKRYWFPWRPNQKADQNLLREQGRTGVPVAQRVFGAGHKLRPQFIQFVRCDRILIDGPRIDDSPFWCIHPVYSRNVTVRNVVITSSHVNSDGVDPDSCSGVLIENCHFDVGDDGVSVKSGRDQDAWRVGIPCERIVIRHCSYSGNAGGGIAIGSEMSGGVRGVYVDDVDAPKAKHAIFIKANLDGGGFVEDVHISNFRAGEVQAFIRITEKYDGDRGGRTSLRYQNMTVRDASCRKAGIGVQIVGDPSAPLKDIVFSNVTIADVTRPSELIDAQGVRFDQVRMNGKPIAAP